MMILQKIKHKGQSLVEFALTITLIFFMMSAAIDFGLAFFAYQAISGAAQEGAQYAASRPVVGGSTLNDTEIKNRVMNEAGVRAAPFPNQARFVNLRDLNNDKVEDPSPTGADGSMIVITSTAIAGSTTNCSTLRTRQECQMTVQVTYNYRPFFAGANLFGASVVPLRTRRSTVITR